MQYEKFNDAPTLSPVVVNLVKPLLSIGLKLDVKVALVEASLKAQLRNYLNPIQI